MKLLPRKTAAHTAIEPLEARIAPARYMWQAGSGNWITPSNWFNVTTGSTATDFPDGVDDQAIFEDELRTITLDGAVTVGLLASQASAVTVINGAGSLNLESSSGAAVIGALQGSLQINVRVGVFTPAGLTIDARTGGSIEFSKDIRDGVSGAGAVAKVGVGSATFSGSVANTYLRDTLVQGGTLSLEKTAGTTAIVRDISISDGAKLETLNANQIGDESSLTLAGTGTLELGADETIRSLGGAGGLLDLGGNTLKIEVASTYAGGFLGDGVLGFGSDGARVLKLTGTDAAANSITLAGVTEITGTFSATNFTANASLSGTGTVGLLALGTGSIAPGTTGVPVGSFSVAGLNFTGGSGMVALDVADAGNDKVVVRPGGTANLGAGVVDLNLNLTAAAALDQSFTLIDNQGTQQVSGTFKDVPEGTVFNFGGIDYVLTYTGGDGNDVVLSSVTAKATVSADGRTATYTDADGDLVTIKSSKGGLTVDRIKLSQPNDIGGASLLLLDATNAAFAGSNISITARPVPGNGMLGGGSANVLRIDAGTNALGTVKVSGDLAEIDAGAVKTLAVATFGFFDQTQAISTLASLGKLTVKGGVDSARLIVTGALGSAKIGGSVTASFFDIGTQVGTFSVRGGFTGGSELTIGGIDNPTAKQALVLKSLTIGGDVTGGVFRIGEDYTTSFGADPNRKNADVQVGKVVVKGNWTRSSFYVGADAGPDKRFGTADDIVIPGGNAVVSRIGSFTIGGLAAGDTGPVTFGIVAEQIGALKIGKAKAALNKTAPDALPLLLTSDFFAREIGAPDPVLTALPNANASVGPAAIELSNLNGVTGFKLEGEAAGDNFGVSVSGAGDVNGDGFADLIVGANFAYSYGGRSGASYVVFGKAGGFGSTLDLSTLDGTTGFQIYGEAEQDRCGISVSGAGDVNGDGFDDLIVGAFRADTNGIQDSGASYVVFGMADFSATAGTMDLSSLDGTNGFKLQGEAENDYSGRSVSGAGDVNGDGFADLIVGAHGASPNGSYSGMSYVVFGNGDFSATAGNLNLSTLDGTTGFKLQGEATLDYSGFSVSRAGDVNGDGFADLIVGAFGANQDSITNSGASYVVFGKADFSATAGSLNLSSLNGTTGFKLQGEAMSDYSGHSVSGAGDVNGDGFDDLIVGAYRVDTHDGDTGASYVVFGKAGGFTATLNLSSLDGTAGFKLQGEDEKDYSGRSVSGAGDVNGDGFADLIVGAYQADPNSIISSGTSYVVFGKAGGFTATLNLSSLDGSTGFKLQGEAEGDRSGVSVSGAGDVNGDGFDDLIVGAYRASPNGDSSGASYVVFGFGTGVATVSADGKTATWLDVDGDTVTLKSSKGGLTAERLHLSTPNALGGSRLVSAEFTDAAFAGSNITITAKTQKGLPTAADGLVAVGSIFAGANALGSVKIAGDLAQLDAAAVKALNVNSLGLFPVATKGAPGTSELASLGALTVKTSWTGMDFTVTGALGKATIGGTVSGATLSATAVGSVKIGGDLIDAKLLIAGVASPTAKTALALKSLAIGGSLKTSDILLGYDATGAPVNAQVQAGKIAIKGNFIASNLIAGTTPGADDLFGTADDAGIGPANGIISRIASITIGGQAFGTPGSDDHFGIVARQIDALKVGKAKIAPSKTATEAFKLGVTGDFTAREVV